MSNSVIYIVTQDECYLNLLRASVESLKRAMPKLPVTVFSQFPIEESNSPVGSVRCTNADIVLDGLARR